MLLARRRRTRTSLLTAFVVIPIALLAGLAGLTGTASAAVTAAVNNPGVTAAQSEAYFSDQINAARAGAGLPALAVAWDIVGVARTWSGVMASGTGLAHNPNVSTQITNWSWIGENVGVGYSDDSLWNAFINSPHHRANILDPNFTQMGVGVVIGSDGYLNVTQDFRRPNGAPAVAVNVAAPPAPVQVPTPPPAAVIAPAPRVQVPAAAPIPAQDPAAVARAALVSRIAAAQHEISSGGTVLRALDFVTVMTGR